LLLSLNLLAFLMHTILELVDEKYQAIRQALEDAGTFLSALEPCSATFSSDSLGRWSFQFNCTMDWETWGFLPG